MSEPRAATLTRPLFCPICGARVSVPTDGKLPEVLRLPEHVPLGNANEGCERRGAVANLCQGVVVMVVLDWDACGKCGRKMSRHPSGLCRGCFKKGGRSP